MDDEAKLTLHGLVQHYIMLNEEEKNRKLNDLLDALDFNQVCSAAPSAYLRPCAQRVCIVCATCAKTNAQQMYPKRKGPWRMRWCGLFLTEAL